MRRLIRQSLLIRWYSEISRGSHDSYLRLPFLCRNKAWLYENQKGRLQRDHPHCLNWGWSSVSLYWLDTHTDNSKSIVGVSLKVKASFDMGGFILLLKFYSYSINKRWNVTDFFLLHVLLGELECNAVIIFCISPQCQPGYKFKVYHVGPSIKSSNSQCVAGTLVCRFNSNHWVQNNVLLYSASSWNVISICCNGKLIFFSSCRQCFMALVPSQTLHKVL